MRIEPFRGDDIEPFLKLAAEEGWLAEPWEFEFLLRSFLRDVLRPLMIAAPQQVM